MTRLPAILLLVTSSVWAINATAADSNQSIATCRDAIAKQLKADPASLDINVGRMRTLGRSRELQFRVSSYDAAGPFHSLAASCRTKLTGEVVEVNAAADGTAIARK